MLSMKRYCGKNWTDDDLDQIRALIRTNATDTRAKLSRKVCEIFDWRKPDGKLKDMSCRVAMLKMHRDGIIELPSPTRLAPKPYKPIHSEACDPADEWHGVVTDLKELTIEPVSRGQGLRLWNDFMARYHYLGYKMLPGAQCRYFIKDGNRFLGLMGFGAAAWKVAPRDNFIGWNKSTREMNLHLIVGQSRFLILPWIHCKNLASKLLAMVRGRLPDDWDCFHGYRPVLMETFVENGRFSGTCYKADNWSLVGNTQGRGKLDRFHTKSVPVKSIWLKALATDFREQLTGRQP